MSLIKSNHGGLGGSGAPGGALGSFYSHTIDQSLRFDGSSSYLYFTPSTAATDSSKMTFSTWVKTWGFGISDGYILSAGSSYIDGVGYTNQNKFTFVRNGSTAVTGNGVRRDPSAWYHLYVTYDADGDGYVRIYVNGVLDNEAAQTTDLGKLGVNGQVQRIMRKSNASTYLDLYLAETHFVDGSIVPIGTFAETKDGVWIPVKTSGITYGNNGWYLDYADSSDVGKDVSGRGNHWTSSGLAAIDVVPDSPVNSFATLNSVGEFYGESSNTKTFSEGNLKVAQSGGGSHDTATIGIESGDTQGYYWEVIVSSMDTARTYIGILSDNPDGGASLIASYYFLNKYVLNRNGNFYGNADRSSTTVSAYTAYAQGDIVMVAYKDGKIWFGVNGTWMNSGDPANGTGFLTAQDGTSPSGRNQSAWLPYFGYRSTFIVNFGQNGTFNGTKTAQGNSDENGIGNFYYSVPSGFLTLCTSNLPDPTIGPGQSEQADDHFNTVLYTGTASTNAITGVGFQPDFVWMKARSTAYSHDLEDSIRGRKRLYTDLTNAEAGGGIDSFDSDGFTLIGTLNTNNASGTTYAAWNWKAGTAFSNDASATGVGTLDSTGSVNQAAGFSIISYTGTIQSGETVAHGLGGVPEMIWAKSRDSSSNWVVFTKDLSSEHTLYFNNTIGQNNSGTTWGNHTSTVFGVDDDPQSNANGDATIAYLFRSIEGYSKVGLYHGNGLADGTFVYTGFRPAWVMIKNITNSGTNFLLFDNKRSTFNVTNDALLAGSSATEYADNSSFAIDMLSNGFKARSSYGDSNQSGSTMIYLAFAESTVKFANAR